MRTPHLAFLSLACLVLCLTPTREIGAQNRFQSVVIASGSDTGENLPIPRFVDNSESVAAFFEHGVREEPSAMQAALCGWGSVEEYLASDERCDDVGRVLYWVHTSERKVWRFFNDRPGARKMMFVTAAVCQGANAAAHYNKPTKIHPTQFCAQSLFGWHYYTSDDTSFWEGLAFTLVYDAALNLAIYRWAYRDQGISEKDSWVLVPGVEVWNPWAGNRWAQLATGISLFAADRIVKRFNDF